MHLSRRGLIKFGAIAGAAVGVPEVLQKTLPEPFRSDPFRVDPEPLAPKGEEKLVPATCPHCGGGMLARVVKNNAVGIKGDPNHPISQGAQCPQGAGLIQTLYHPDRIRGPLKRAGDRGTDSWKPVSWDEALASCADELKKRQGKVGVFAGRTNSLAMRTILDKFAKTLGGAGYYDLSLPEGQGPDDAAAKMMGIQSGVGFDLARAEMVLSIGSDFLQTSESPIATSRAYGLLRRGRDGIRGRLVSAEPRMSLTAAKADEWLPVKPGTDAAFALAVAHVLLRDKLYDQSFVAQYTDGFQAFQDRVLRDFAPSAIAPIVDVPPDKIEATAHDFGTRKPAIAICDRSSQAAQMATMALNALVGNIGQLGGIRTRQWSFAATQIPDPASGAPKLDSLDAMLLYHADPLMAQPQAWQKPLQKAGFVVSIAHFMDETTRQADLVLPDVTPLEGLSDALVWTVGGSPILSVSAPAVPPLYDTRHAGDVIADLAHRIGASDFAWNTYDDALQALVKPIYDANRGKQLRTVELAEEDWGSTGKESIDIWYKKLCQSGGWTEDAGDDKPQTVAFATPSKKLEFHAEDIQAPASVNPPADYPLRLCVYTPLTMAEGRGAHLPYLAGIAGQRVGHRQWETWVEINPQTAKALGIENDEWAVIESANGSFKARAVLFQGARPDVVSVPFGLGHSDYGRWAKGLGANPVDILEADSASGEPRRHLTNVRVTKGVA